MRRRKGQSVLEYVIVLTAIVAIVAVAAGKWIAPAVENALQDSSNAVEDAGGRLPGN
jgi:Flp pilus assembly pilin Flp